MAKNRREFLGNSLKLAGASLAFVAFDDLYALEATTNTISPIKETTMNELTPTAKANLERLFGTSKLPQEDLEFFTNYANFAFDEVWEKSPLQEHERLLIILASLVAIPAKEEFGTMLNAALNLGINPIAIKEVVYQATPYVGMGKIAEIVSLTNTIFKQRGIKLPLESPSYL